MQKEDRIKIEEALKNTINESLYRAVISKPLGEKEISKIVVRPVQVKGEICFQQTIYKGTQVFHGNFSAEEIIEKTVSYFGEIRFGQFEGECADQKVLILMNKKGTVTVKAKKLQLLEQETVLAHDRTKKYLLPDGEPVDFLIALGVQTPDGKVVKARYDKFRQINRYLEFVRDVLPALEDKEPIRIVDFGCGKSYLTFALYYYLKVRLGRRITVIGLDLKKDVIADCSALKDRLGYEDLVFLHGDIKDFEGFLPDGSNSAGSKKEDLPDEGDVGKAENSGADMVVSLHACDTATDYALQKAVGWNASVILAVPCCQHELNRQIKAGQVPQLAPVLKYGLIKERMAALITDAYRANCLENAGYDVQVMEFIDMEHTPKNILLRAVRSKKMKAAGSDGTKKLDEFFQIEPTISKLLPK